jgi:hypothetical protein
MRIESVPEYIPLCSTSNGKNWRCPEVAVQHGMSGIGGGSDWTVEAGVFLRFNPENGGFEFTH